MNNERGNIGLIIGIIVIILVIAIVGVIFLVNGNKDSKDGTVQNIANTSNNKSNNENEENNSNQIDFNNWGVPDSINTENSSGIMGTAYIHLPEVASMRRGAGQVADQSDDTLIILGGQHLESPIVTNLKEVLSTFISQPVDVLSKYRRVDYKNFAFNVETSEMVKINDYDMCKYTGTHTYTYNGEPGSMKFVAYATQLKENGAYVYWMVIDETEDQSMTNTIMEHATNMAYTFHE